MSNNRLMAFLSALFLVAAFLGTRKLDADLKNYEKDQDIKVYNSDGSAEYGPIDEARTLQWQDYPESRNNDFLIFEDPKTKFNRIAPVGHIDAKAFYEAFEAFRHAPTAEDGYNAAMHAFTAE